MTDKKYIVALDQGTTSSRAVVMDHDANIVSVSQREFEQIYPRQAGLNTTRWRSGRRKAHAGRSAGKSRY
jgi:glycerol kinase